MILRQRIKRAPAFYIAVDPVGSKFAKALQSSITEKTTGRVLRIHPARLATKRSIINGRAKVFHVTSQVHNKIQQLTRFKQHNVSCPDFTTDSSQVNILNSKTVFARTLVNATNGRGIVEFVPGTDQTPAAPLYTAYIPKKAEYRFHVFNGEVVDIQEKRKKRGFEEDRNTRVRNVNNGYVYCRDNITVPAGAAELAIAAVAALNYTYGAVDLVYNEKKNQCYVLEVNSRPGLMNTTLDKYSNAIVNMFTLEKK